MFSWWKSVGNGPSIVPSQDPWLWAETDSHSEGFHSEGDAETGDENGRRNTRSPEFPIKIKFNLQDAYSMELVYPIRNIPWKVGVSLIWIWCLFFKSPNSCFRHLKGLRLASSRDQNCELQLIFQRTDRSLNYCRWLQTVRDLKLESFSKISLEKVWKGERWVSNTEMSFERLWTLLVDVVLRVSYGVFVGL